MFGFVLAFVQSEMKLAQIRGLILLFIQDCAPDDTILSLDQLQCLIRGPSVNAKLNQIWLTLLHKTWSSLKSGTRTDISAVYLGNVSR